MRVTERYKKDRDKKQTQKITTTLTEDGPRLGCDADLPFLEKVVYFVVYCTCLVAAVFKIYKFPTENPDELYKEDFKDGWQFTGRKRDISDFEWEFWSGQFRFLVISSFLHCLGSRIVARLFPEYRMEYFAVFQLGLIWYGLGWKPMLVFFGHNVLYYITSQFKSVLFSWLIGVVLLISFVSIENLTKWQFYKFTNSVNDGDFVLFTSLMCQLRGMSFCLDSCLAASRKDNPSDVASEVQYGFMDLLGYNLYLPLFCNGPVVLYDDFYQQVKKPPDELSKDVLLGFARDALKTIWWFIAMEFSFHYLYITSMARDQYIISIVPVWTSTGLMYTLVLLFYLKYVVFYRFAGMFARLDGVYPPGIPRCVLGLYLFTDMWKYFDQGLHNWLMKYIYIPLGGSKNGILKQVLSSMTCFAYVYYWHGAYDYLLYWVIIQWLGVFLESVAGKLLKTKIIQHLENDVLLPSATRRLHAIIGVFTLTAAILSNVIFLVNYPSVTAYLHAVIIEGGVWTVISCTTVTYCLVQVIMEVNLQRKELSHAKKNL